VLMSSNHHLMGRWVNKRSTTILGWLVTALMAVAGLATIGFWLFS
jgi:Mn2+/Fe2+ NRAMP family transporter